MSPPAHHATIPRPAAARTGAPPREPSKSAFSGMLAPFGADSQHPVRRRGASDRDNRPAGSGLVPGCATTRAPNPSRGSSDAVSYAVIRGLCEHPKQDPHALAERSLAAIHHLNRAPNAQVLRVRCAVPGETFELITGRTYLANHWTQWIVEGRGYYFSARSGGPAPTPDGQIGHSAPFSGECGFHVYDDATAQTIGYGYGRCDAPQQEPPPQ